MKAIPGGTTADRRNGQIEWKYYIAICSGVSTGKSKMLGRDDCSGTAPGAAAKSDVDEEPHNSGPPGSAAPKMHILGRLAFFPAAR